MVVAGWWTCSLLVAVAVCASAVHSVRVHRVINEWPNSMQNGPRAQPRYLRPDKDVPVNRRYPAAVLIGRTCGGTLISSRWVLTSAHCTLFFNTMYGGGVEVVAGTNNTESVDAVRVPVKKLYVHPLFAVGPHWLNAKKYDIKQVHARWDFMLAELKEPIQLDGVTIAAAQVDTTPALRGGEKVGFAGYGAAHHGETMRSEMHENKLSILEDTQCAQQLEQFSAKDMICARGFEPNFDAACNGDSGSGLMSGDRVVGVASWVEDDAVECGKGKVVVFARVSAARDWINRITGI